MKDKVKVMLRDGSMISLEQWQTMYDLDPKSDKIGRYFSLSENRFQNDISLFGELIVNELLIKVLDGYREITRKPVIINSFNRSQEKQDQLRKGKFRAATHSPHVVKMAADVDTPGVLELMMKNGWPKEKASLQAERINYDEVIYLRRAASKLQIKIRVGHKEYLSIGQTFFHVDVCPEFYAAGKPFHHIEHPKVWETENTW